MTSTGPIVRIQRDPGTKQAVEVMLADMVGRPSVCLGHEGSGQPRMLDLPDWHVSLSRSSGWLALAASTVGPIGVDCEVLRGVPKAQDIADRWVPGRQLPRKEPERTRAFLSGWVICEALVKAAGGGYDELVSICTREHHGILPLSAGR